MKYNFVSPLTFFNWYSLFSRLNSHRRTWNYKKKNKKKMKSIQESWLEKPKDKKCLRSSLNDPLHGNGKAFKNDEKCFLLSLRPYRSRDFEISSCLQNGFFILLWWVRPWIVFVRCLLNYKIIWNENKLFI